MRAVRGTAAGAAGMFSNYMQLCPHLNKMSFYDYLLACFVHWHKLCTLTLCVTNGTVPTLECQLNSSGGCISHYQMYRNYSLLCCVSTTGMLTMSNGLVSSPRQALSGTVRHRQAQSGTVVAPGVAGVDQGCIMWWLPLVCRAWCISWWLLMSTWVSCTNSSSEGVVCEPTH